MNLKKSLALCLAAAAILTLLCACGSPASSKTETTTVKIGVTGSFYEDLWQPAKELLKKDGIDLQIVQFSDFVTPNNALANGEIDLNAFQHRVYLESEVKNYGYAIQNIGNTLIIPLNIYSQKVSSVSVGGAYAITGSGLQQVETQQQQDTSGVYVIAGTGMGHNIGMSQWGAYAMAQKGFTAEEIIRFYYTGVTVDYYDPN